MVAHDQHEREHEADPEPGTSVGTVRGRPTSSNPLSSSLASTVLIETPSSTPTFEDGPQARSASSSGTLSRSPSRHPTTSPFAPPDSLTQAHSPLVGDEDRPPPSEPASTTSSPISTTALSALPSPPDSPYSSSSLPSLSSSFFHTTTGAQPSPADSQLDLELDDSDVEQEGDGETRRRAALNVDLIIPSLLLPPALRRETVHGETLGALRVLFVGADRTMGAELERLARQLVSPESNEDVVECADVQDEPEEEGVVGSADSSGDDRVWIRRQVLKASTTWTRRQGPDVHGHERRVGSRNVSVHMHTMDLLEGTALDSDEVSDALLKALAAPFLPLLSVLDASTPPSALIQDVLSGHTMASVGNDGAGLWTLVIYVRAQSTSASVSTPSSQAEAQLIDLLARHVPLVVLTTPPPPPLRRRPREYTLTERAPARPTHGLASLQHLLPASSNPDEALAALRLQLFRRPDALRTLRQEAAERFLWWREVRLAADGIARPARAHGAEWARRWETELSRDVAVELRRRARERARGTDTVSVSVPVPAPSPPPTARPSHSLSLSHSYSFTTGLPRASRTRTHAHVPSPTQMDEKAGTGPDARAYGRLDATEPFFLDPLHVPSLVALGASILSAVKMRVREALGANGAVGVGLVAFVAGVGVGASVWARM